jgi:hypothetical protein
VETEPGGTSQGALTDTWPAWQIGVVTISGVAAILLSLGLAILLVALAYGGYEGG